MGGQENEAKARDNVHITRQLFRANNAGLHSHKKRKIKSENLVAIIANIFICLLKICRLVRTRSFDILFYLHSVVATGLSARARACAHERHCVTNANSR